MGIRSKLLIIFILLSALPVLTVGIFYSYETRQTVKQQVGDFAQRLVSQQAIILSGRISELEKAINIVMHNSEMLDLLSQTTNASLIEEINRGLRIKESMELIVYQHLSVKSAIWFDFNNEVKVYGEKIAGSYSDKLPQYSRYFLDNQEALKSSELFNEIVQGNGRPFWVTGLQEDYNRIFLMKYLFNWKQSKPLGIIIFAIDPDKLFEFDIETDFQSIYETMTLDRDGKVFNHSEQTKLGERVNTDYWVEIQNGGSSAFTSGSDLVSYSEVNNGWYLVSSVPVSSLMQDLTRVHRATMIIALLCIVLSITIAFLFSKHFSQRIYQLIRKMLRIETGDWRIQERVKGNDEISVLDRHFDRMVQRLHELIRKNYIQELKQREAELNALQFQINPHFLYNTLESINSIALVNGRDDIREISQRLGNMFRYSIHKKQNQLVRLKDELQHIENYIYLQKVRFGDSFEVHYDINKCVTNQKIVKFILQPIVENAIVHGFEHLREKGRLYVRAYQESGLLILEVQDNGSGIQEEKLREMTDQLEHGLEVDSIDRDEKSGIGLSNVHQRIILTCGASYGLKISSSLHKGTCVMIRLPFYNRGGGEKDEDSGR
ncbi:sensor histidine kinase [Paenibacillus chungangensis]|uniref:histidine kinase n=1 Tax=Paenibacillus chungangensis TaxID=696535 RepID=A0ABW3HL82_9BACL